MSAPVGHPPARPTDCPSRLSPGPSNALGAWPGRGRQFLSVLLPIGVYFLEGELFRVNRTNLLLVKPPSEAPMGAPPHPAHPNLPPAPRFLPPAQARGACCSLFTWDCHGAGERDRRNPLGFGGHARFPPPAARTRRCPGGVFLAPRRQRGEALRDSGRGEPSSRRRGFRGDPIAQHTGQTIPASCGGTRTPAYACRKSKRHQELGIVILKVVIGIKVI